MRYATHTIRLTSRAGYGRRIPPAALGGILDDIPDAVRGAIRIVFEGRSAQPGRCPSWLESASDVRFVGHEGETDTLLQFEAPRLGEAAKELYGQQELWPTKPDEEDTGFDLLGDVLDDVRGDSRDSVLYDGPLLKRVARFGKRLNGVFQEISIEGRRHPSNRPAKVDQKVVKTAERLLAHTPTPQQVRVVGVLDMIRSSTSAFALKLQDGSEVRGVLAQGEIEELRGLFDKKVLVLGKSVFRPSGQVLRIDAKTVSLADEGESEIWSQAPEPASATFRDTTRLRKPQGPRSGLAAIIGKWPGEESEEEIHAALEAVS